MERYRIIDRTKSNIILNFVFCTRYKRKALVEDVEKRLRELIKEVCTELDIIVLKIQIEPNYVFLTLNILPTISTHETMTRIKGATSKILREEFSHLKHLTGIWTRYFLVSTENILEDDIKEFMKNQKSRG